MRPPAYLVSLCGLAVLALTGSVACGRAAPTNEIAAEVAPSRRWVASPEVKLVENPVRPTAAALAEAEKAFRVNCANCHGEQGDGNGPASVVLPRKAANFTDAKAMASMTDGELFWKMSTGRAPMPGWNDLLPLEQRWELVNYIRTFARAINAKTSAPE